MKHKFPQAQMLLKVIFSRCYKLVGLFVLGIFLFTALLAFAYRPQAHAATNNNLNFQARLQTSSGAIVPDGYYNVEFKLYSAVTGGTALWTETYYDTNGVTAGNDFRVRVQNGYLTVNLGSLTAFPTTINWDQQLWVTMNIGGSTQTATPTYDGEMTPRLQLTGVPYAFKAGQLATGNGTFQSTLQIIQPTGGNQVFQIADHTTAGTFTLLDNVNGVQLQATTPGTTQTGNFNITGTGIVNGNLIGTIVIANNGLNTGSGNGTQRLNGSGQLVNINGYTQASGNFDDSASTGTFATSSGAVSLNGDTVVAQNKNLSLASGTGVLSQIYTGSAGANSTVIALANTSGNNSGLLVNRTAAGGTTDSGITVSNSGGTMTNGLSFAGTIGTDITRSSGTLGVNGAGGINLQTNGATTASLSATGAALYKNSADSATAFQVQNNATASLVNVDTANSNIQLLGNNDSKLSAWNTTTAMNIGSNTNRVRGSAVAANGYIYNIAGNDGTGATIATVQYAKLNADGTVGAWASTTSLPGSRRQFQAVATNGYLYVIGGRDNANGIQATSYYAKLNNDGTVGSWNTTTALTAARFGGGTGAYNGYMYYFGGFDNTVTVKNTVYYTKINADGTFGATWTTSATNLPVALTNANATFANGYIYLIGGFTTVDIDSAYYAKLNTDGTTGAWTTQTTAFPGGGDENILTFVSNGYIYIIGSENNAQTLSLPLNANGSLGTYTNQSNGPVSPTTVGEAAGAIYNGYFYVLGGSSSADGTGTVRNTVYYSSTSRLKVGGNLDLVGYGGETVNEGNTGGSLTAGNTSIIGLLQVQDVASFSRGISVTGNLSVTGDAVIKSGTNSVTGFQIQPASSTTPVFNVDTVNGRVGIGNAAPGYPLDVTGNINTSTGYYVGGTAGASTTCTGGQVLQNAVVIGGISTAGTCVSASGAGATSVAFSTTQNANGGSIATNVLTLAEAGGSNPGLISGNAQSFNGSKTFAGLITGSLGLTVSGGSISLSGTTNINSGSASTTTIGSGTGNTSIGNTTGTISLGGNTSITGSRTLNVAGATTLAALTANGVTTLNDRLLLGALTLANTSNYRAQISGLLTLAAANTSSSQYGFQNTISFDASLATNTTTIYGMANNPLLANGTTNIGKFIGSSSSVDVTGGAGNYTGTLASAFGFEVSVPTISGTTVADYRGINIPGVTTNGANTTGTIDNAQLRIGNNTTAAASGGTVNNYGIHLTVPNASGVGTTTNTGIFLTGGSAGANNYAINNTSSAANYLKGATILGSSSAVLGGGYALQVTGGITATTGYSFGTTAGSTTTCSGGQFLQNSVVSGGIITGGTCAAAGGSGATSVAFSTTQTSTGGSIAGGVLTLSEAGGTNPGLISGNAQSFAGNKTFTGATLSRNASNSTSAFSVQNTASTDLLTVDTTNSAVVIGRVASGTAAAASLYFGDTCTNFTQTCVKIGEYGGTDSDKLQLHGAAGINFTAGYGVADAGAITYSGGPRFGIGTTAPGAVITGVGSQVGVDLLRITDSTATAADVLVVADEGATTFKNRTNSTTAFQIQPAASSTSVLDIDTTNSRVGIGNNAPAYALDVTGDINTSSVYRVAGASGTASSCSASQFLQNATVVGGIVTGGSCVAAVTSTSFVTVPTANVGSISGNVLTLYGANASFAGAVTTSNQVFAGNKDFNGNLTANGGANTLGTANSTGVTTINDRLVIAATTGTYTSGNRVQLTGNFTSSAASSQYGIQSDLSFTPSGGALSNLFGITSTPTIAGSNYNIGQFSAINAGVDTASGYTGQVASGYGLDISAPTIGGSQLIPDYRGISVSGGSSNGGNTTGLIENAQLRFNGNSAAAGAGGTLVNYGIYNTLGNGNTTGTTNYGLYLTGNGGASASGNFAVYATSNAANYLKGTLMLGGGTAGYTAPAAGIGLQLQGTNNGINTTGSYYQNGTIGSTTSCTGGQFLQNAVVAGGIVTGGSCVAGGSGATSVAFSTTQNAAGGSISGGVLTLAEAGGTNPGLISGNAQSFNGVKTFSAGLISSGATDIVTSGSVNVNILTGSAGGDLTIGNGVSGTMELIVNAENFSLSSLSAGIGGDLSKLRNLAIGGSFNQANASTFSTGTGAISLNGSSTTISGTTAINANTTIKPTTNSATAFQVQNASGAPVLLVDTTTTNLISNPGFEVNTTGWSTFGSGTGLAIAQNNSKTNAFHGLSSLLVTTANGTANTGTTVASFTSAPTPTQYALSFSIMGGATNGTFATLSASVTGGSAPVCTLSSNSVVTTGFNRYSCVFTTTTSNITALNIFVTDTTQHTFYLDAVQLTTTTGSVVTPYNIGSIQLRGIITNPLSLQTTSNSTTAFQIQNATGNSNTFVVDTLNGRVGVGKAPTATFDVNGSVNSSNGAVTLTANAASSLTTSAGLLTLTGAGGVTLTGGTGVLTAGNTGLTGLGLNLVAPTYTNATRGVTIGTADANITLLDLDQSSTITAETAANCTTSINAGGLYYNSAAGSTTTSGSNAIRACVGGAWEDVVTTAGLGIMLFGVVPDSGLAANQGDTASLITSGLTGPCKVSAASATTIRIEACTAYSGGRKIIITQNTSLAITVTSGWVHVCFNGTSNAILATNNASETAGLPTWVAGSPILCIADVAVNGTTITQVYDTRTFTNTTKEFVTTGAAVGLGQIVTVDGTTKSAVSKLGAGAGTGKIRGIVVATDGSTSITAPKAVIATSGSIWVKATAGTAGDYLEGGATSGYADTAATVATPTIYGIIGLARTTYAGVSCATTPNATNCAGSVYAEMRLR